MPKRRKKRAPANGIRFEEIPTAEMLIFDERNLDKIESSKLEGAFVKVAPRIPASKRETFPAESVQEYIRANGALGVVMAPIFVPDGKKGVRKESRKLSVGDMIAEWLNDQNIDDETKNDVRDLIYSFIEAEGF